MARAPRNEVAPGRYHVNIKGNDGMDIVRDDVDRVDWHRRLAVAAVRFAWNVECWTLLTNHAHWMIETSRPNLGVGMRWLNGGYALNFNRRHGRKNHLFGDRFFAVPVEDESHALTVIRYIALNAVAAGIVERPEDYRWCSYAATIGLVERPSFLADTDILRLFGPAGVARRRLAAFVEEGIGDARVRAEGSRATARALRSRDTSATRPLR
jgi:REP element-mobilizing transposase RayT